MAGISRSAGSGAVTGNVSKAIASLARTWSARNMTIGEAGVGNLLTDRFVNLAHAMLVAIALVYLLIVILFGSLLVPLVILFALPLVVIGGFVSLSATGHATNIIPGLWASAWST